MPVQKSSIFNLKHVFRVLIQANFATILFRSFMCSVSSPVSQGSELLFLFVETCGVFQVVDELLLWTRMGLSPYFLSY